MKSSWVLCPVLWSIGCIAWTQVQEKLCRDDGFNFWDIAAMMVEERNELRTIRLLLGWWKKKLRGKFKHFSTWRTIMNDCLWWFGSNAEFDGIHTDTKQECHVLRHSSVQSSHKDHQFQGGQEKFGKEEKTSNRFPRKWVDTTMDSRRKLLGKTQNVDNTLHTSLFLMQWTRTHCCTSHCMAQVLVHASSHPHKHPCVWFDRLFSSFFFTLFSSVCFSCLFFFCLNLDLYFFLFHVDFIGAISHWLSTKWGVWPFGQWHASHLLWAQHPWRFPLLRDYWNLLPLVRDAPAATSAFRSIAFPCIPHVCTKNHGLSETGKIKLKKLCGSNWWRQLALARKSLERREKHLWDVGRQQLRTTKETHHVDATPPMNWKASKIEQLLVHALPFPILLRHNISHQRFLLSTFLRLRIDWCVSHHPHTFSSSREALERFSRRKTCPDMHYFSQSCLGISPCCFICFLAFFQTASHPIHNSPCGDRNLVFVVGLSHRAADVVPLASLNSPTSLSPPL